MKIAGMGKGNVSTGLQNTAGKGSTNTPKGVQVNQKDSVTLSQSNYDSAINPQNGVSNPANPYQKRIQSYTQVQQVGQIGNNTNTTNNITINKFNISMQNSDNPTQKGLSLSFQDLLQLIKELWKFFNDNKVSSNGKFVLIKFDE